MGIQIEGPPLLWVVIPVVAYLVYKFIASGAFLAQRLYVRRVETDLVREHSNRDRLTDTVRGLRANEQRSFEEIAALTSAIAIHQEQVGAIIQGPGVPHFDDETDEFTQADQELYRRFQEIRQGNFQWSAAAEDTTLLEPPDFALPPRPGLTVLPIEEPTDAE